MVNKVRHIYDDETGEFIPDRRPITKARNAWAGIRAWPWKKKILAIAAILRIYQIGAAAFWYDEGVSAVFARLPWSKMIAATAGDVHPPGYYIILWLIAKTGVPITEITARVPSLIFSLLTVYLTGLLVTRLELPSRGQIAVMIWVAISPLQLHYAQEARMYSLLQALVLLAIYLILERRNIWLAVVLTSILYIHNYGVFYLPALALASLLYDLDFSNVSQDYRHYIDSPFTIGVIRNWFKLRATSFIIPALLFIPWLIVLFGQMSTISGGYWIQPVTFPAVIFVFYQLLFAYSMPPTFQGLGVLLTCGILIYSAWRSYRSKPSYYIFLVAIVLAPLLLAVVMSIIWRPLLLFRGLIGTAIPLIILVTKAIEEIKPDYKKYYAYLIIGVTLAAGLAGHYLYNAENKGDTITWVHGIKDNFSDGDIIISLNDNGIIAAMTYAPELPLYKLTSCGADPLGSLSQATRDALEIQEQDIENLIGQVYDYNASKNYSRVWFISTVAPISPACEIEAANAIINSDSYRVELINELADTEYMQAGIYLITSEEIY